VDNLSCEFYHAMELIAMDDLAKVMQYLSNKKAIGLARKR